jgi:hypothetical protein
MQIIRIVKRTFLIAGRENMNWTQTSTEHKVPALDRVCLLMEKIDLPAESEKKE